LVPALNLDDNLQTIVGGVLYIMMLATASSRHS
jgi:hypothetical protein